MTTPPDKASVEQIEHDALVRHAQLRLDQFEDRRVAHRFHEQGWSQRDIAALLHLTQPRVHRMLAYVEEFGDEVTPEEVILRATVGGTDRDALVTALSEMTYTFTDGTKRGGWADLSAAVAGGYLSQEEFTRIREVIQPSSP